MDAREILSAQAVAEALGLTPEAISEYTRKKTIPCVGEDQYLLHEVMSALAGVREDTATYRTQRKPFTYKDYLKLPDEPGWRYEVLNGQLVKEPPPSVLHQRIIGKLHLLLAPYFGQRGELFVSPLDVTFGKLTVVQPDLLYVAKEHKGIVKKTRIDGPPTLAIEVISPASRRKDSIQKMQIYLRAGVAHYWLVDPDRRTLTCFVLENGSYKAVVLARDSEVAEHPHFPGLKLPLAKLRQHS